MNVRSLAFWGPLLCASALVAPSARAEEPAPAYTVAWPAGWAVSRGPGETACKQPGVTAQAVKEQGGSVIAALQIMQLGRCDGGRAKLDQELATAVRVVRERYESGGLTVSVGPPRKSRLGGLPALEADVSITDPEVDLRILMAIAFGRHHVFSFTFAARRPDHERYQPELQSTLASLKLR
jgi:hypothetical protein